MYTEILNTLIGFHTCSHISFALTNNYPFYYKTIYYPIFASTDVLVHYYLMKDEESYISGLWLVWHLIKSIKYFKNLRSLYYINWFEAATYFYEFSGKLPNSLLGMALYIPCRIYGLTW